MQVVKTARGRNLFFSTDIDAEIDRVRGLHTHAWLLAQYSCTAVCMLSWLCTASRMMKQTSQKISWLLIETMALRQPLFLQYLHTRTHNSGGPHFHLGQHAHKDHGHRRRARRQHQGEGAGPLSRSLCAAAAAAAITGAAAAAAASVDAHVPAKL
jgi:hypothetical protein